MNKKIYRAGSPRTVYLYRKGIFMRNVCDMIRRQAEPNFINLETAIRTYDRNSLVCGAPAWRYVYHTIHSADKWFFNPSVFTEPQFHEQGMDNPDKPCETVLSDDLLLDYLHAVREKTLAYLDNLTDDELNDCPENCEYTRLELILMQFRHISVHTGMLNGQTIERTGRFPVYVGPTDSSARLSNGYFEE